MMKNDMMDIPQESILQRPSSCTGHSFHKPHRERQAGFVYFLCTKCNDCSKPQSSSSLCLILFNCVLLQELTELFPLLSLILDLGFTFLNRLKIVPRISDDLKFPCVFLPYGGLERGYSTCSLCRLFEFSLLLWLNSRNRFVECLMKWQGYVCLTTGLKNCGGLI